MFFIELVAVLFSLTAVWLSIKKNTYIWPMGIIGVIAYLYIFYSTKLYADCLLQIFFIVQGIYGWYNWKIKLKNDLNVSKWAISNSIISFLMVVLVTFLIAQLLKAYTDASSPYPDAFASCLSLMANWLMTKKKIESWIYWIAADLIYIGLFLYKGLHLSSFLYLVFLIMSIGGLINWNRQRNLSKGFY